MITEMIITDEYDIIMINNNDTSNDNGNDKNSN